MSVPITWSELIARERLESQQEIASRADEIASATPDDIGWLSYRWVRALARAVPLLGSRGVQPYLERVVPRAPDVLRALASVRAEADPEGVMYPLAHLSVLRCGGAAMPPEAAAVERQAVEQLAALASCFVDSMRHHALFLAVEAADPASVAALSGGAPLDARIEPGKTFGPAVDSFARYLATAIAAGAAPAEVRPAWLDFVRCFPLKLAAESVEWVSLFHAATAYYVNIERLPWTAVPDALHALVSAPEASRGQPERHELAVDEVAEDMREAAPDHDWEQLSAMVQGDREHRLDEVRQEARQLAASPRVAARLAVTAEQLARLAALLGPSACGPLMGSFPPILGRAAGELMAGGDPPALYGFHAHQVVATCIGAPIPPPFAGLEGRWIEQLAAQRGAVDAAQGEAIGFAALSAGRADLARLFAGPTDTAWTPGRSFGGAGRPLLGYLASALERRASAADVEPAFLAYAEGLPSRLRGDGHPWTKLMYATRAYVQHFVRADWRGSAEVIHAHVRRFATARAQAEAERAAAALDVSAWTSIHMRDLHGLYDGYVVHVARSADLWVEHAQGYQVVRRYHTTLPLHLLSQLHAFLRHHDLRRVRPPARHGVPGEGCPEMMLRTPGGMISTRKWAGDRDADFDPIHSFLTSVARFVIPQTPITHEGPYEHDWMPWR